MRLFKKHNDPERAAMWLTIDSVAKDVKDNRAKIARLEGDISKLRRVVKREARHPTPEFEGYEFDRFETRTDFTLPKNGGSRADSSLMGYAERDDLRGVCRCGCNAEEHGCPKEEEDG